MRIKSCEQTFFHASDNGGEVVIQKDHVSGLLGHVTSGDTHGDTDVGLFQSGRIVHTVAGHSHDGALALTAFNDDEFLLGGGTGKDNLCMVSKNVINLGRGHVTQIGAVDDTCLSVSGEDKYKN